MPLTVTDGVTPVTPVQAIDFAGATVTNAGGGVAGVAVTHAALPDVTADQHHAQAHHAAHEPSGADAMAVDAAAITGSLRTLGSGGLQAAGGTHTHAGIGTVIVQEDDTTVDAAAGTIDFGHGLDITSSPAGEANVAVDEAELDHGLLAGLGDDDHPQYLTSAEGAAAYQPLDSDLTAIAALSTTGFGRAFLALADAAAGRTALGLGTAAVAATGDFDAAGAAAAAQAASQPLDSDLTAIAALATTSYGRALLALADAAAGRTALGLGSFAVLSSLAHSATTGQTANDHHAQAHALNSADHTAPSGDISINTHKLTDVLDPTSAQDAATKAYVDAVAVGLSIKASCRLATAAALPANTYSNGSSGVGATITGLALGTLSVDGVLSVVGDRVLVKNEATGSHNGIYTVTASAVGVLFILTRATDFDQAADLAEGDFTFIEEGTQAAQGWLLTTAGPYTMGTTALAFTQFSAAGEYTAGNGIDITGAVVSAVFGSPSTQAFGDAAANGAANSEPRSDHKHGMPNSTAGPDADVTVDAAGAAGTAATAARAGHGHKVVTYASAATALGTAAAGTSGDAPSRGTHVHNHGTGTVANAHAHADLSGIAATDHHAAPIAGPDADTTIDAAGAAGTAGTFARSAHGHRVDTTAGPGAAVAIDAAGAAGATGAAARAAHGHRVDTTAGPGADVAVGAAGAAGATGALARTAHGHRVDPDAGGGAAVTIDAAATAGTATTLARGGHGHRLDTYASNPAALGAASAGTSGDAPSRGSHVHPTTGVLTTATAAGGDLAGTYPNPTVAQASGAFALPGDETSTLTGAQDNVTLAAGTSVLRWNGASASTWTGLTGGADGRIVVLQNVTTAQTLTLSHDVTSTAANRFYLPNSVTMSLLPNEEVLLVYDATSSRWRVSGDPVDTAAGADVALDAAGTAGTAGYAAASGHGHRLNTSASAAAAVGTAAAGTSGHAPSRDDHVHPTGAGTPSTQAFGDAATVGSGPAAPMTDHKHAMPANPVSYASPAIVLGSAAAAGSAATLIRSDATVAAFDTTAPAAVTPDAAAAVGTIAFAARRDHQHGMATSATAAVALGAAAAGTSGHSPSRDDHVHPTTGLLLSGASAGGDLSGAYPNPSVVQAAGAFALPSDVTITTTGTIDDYALASTTAVLRWNGASAATLNSMTGGADGRLLVVLNVTTAQTLTLKHNAGTTAGARFFLPNDVDGKIGPDSGLAFVYDATSSRWRVASLLQTYASAAAAIGTAAAGTAGEYPSRGDHVHATGAGTPSTQAFGDAAATGSGPAASMTDHKHAMPNSTAGPDANATIDVAGAAGTAATAARSGHGHQVVTSAGPGADITKDAAGAAGATGALARAGHGHQVVTDTSTPLPAGTAAAGTSGTVQRAGHIHPGATLGYAAVTTGKTTVTTLADWAGLSVTVTVVAGHRIKITAYTGGALSSVSNDEAGLQIRESSTTLQSAFAPMGTIAQEQFLHAVCILTPSTGSHTYKISVERHQGTGTLNFQAETTYPSFILVEDIGV